MEVKMQNIFGWSKKYQFEASENNDIKKRPSKIEGPLCYILVKLASANAVQVFESNFQTCNLSFFSTT